MTDHQLARDLAANPAWPDDRHGMTNGRYWPEVVIVGADETDTRIDMSWDDGSGACRGMDPTLFFPSIGENAEPAKAVCRRCPLLEPCRAHGLRHERFGVWGGLSEKDRRAWRREAAAGRVAGRPIVPIRHGTDAGYQKHNRFPELFGPPCAECRRAAAIRKAEHERKRRLRVVGES